MKGMTWINLLVGIWLIIAAWALPGGAAGGRMASDVILGILLIAFSWWTLGAVTAPAAAIWLQVICGIWLVIAPFALGFHASNSVICGIVAIVVALIATGDVRTRTAA